MVGVGCWARSPVGVSMRIIDRYLATALLTGTLQVLAVLLGLTLFVSLVSKVEDMGVDGHGFAQVLQSILLGLPQLTYEIFPVAVLLGALFSLGGLAENKELIVLRAAGLSVFRLALSAALGGVLLMGLCYLLGSWLAPQALRLEQDLRAQASAERGARIGDEVWLRDGSYIVNVERIAAADTLSNVRIYAFSDARELVWAGHARWAHIESGGWRLSEFTRTDFRGEGAEVTQADNWLWTTGVDHEIVQLFAVRPEMLSVTGLHHYVRFLEENGLHAAPYRMMFWRKIVSPFTVLVMIFVAIPFVFGPLRDVGAGQRLLAGALVGLGYYLGNETVAGSSQLLGLSPVVAAWLPTAVIFALAMAGIRRIQ